MDSKFQLVLIIESGLMGILGGVIPTIMVSILTQRKNETEVKKLEAETKKLHLEIDSIKNAPGREILKDLHGKMLIAIGSINDLIFPVGIHSDLNVLSTGALDEYLKDTPFSDYEKQALRASQDKNGYYQRVLFQHKQLRAVDAVIDFHNFRVINSYAITEKILSLCIELDTLLINATEGTKFKQAAGIDVKLADIDILYKKMLPVQEEIENMIKAELNPM